MASSRCACKVRRPRRAGHKSRQVDSTQTRTGEVLQRTRKERKMRTDTELQHAVMEELTWEPSVDAAEIGVSAESGIVTLSGMVKSLPQKWQPEKAVKRVFGGRGVRDRIADS